MLINLQRMKKINFVEKKAAWRAARSSNSYFVRFQVLTAANMKFRIFWDVAPCSHVEVD
jgi:hypothetical protein